MNAPSVVTCCTGFFLLLCWFWSVCLIAWLRSLNDEHARRTR